ncbi:hypothetical protein [Pyxidicoccus trucidator]|uniref:hypothetical protein n=1 Tax=Pyxidicoccus trucidator TaxID=2709662 RepID=UPI0013D9F441|nr:hypothetical protein [Pyxidicoccus trucidator]
MRSFGKTLPDQTSNEKAQGIRIIASSLFRELVAHGYSQSHVISLTSELLELLTASLERARGQPRDGALASLLEDTPDTDP